MQECTYETEDSAAEAAQFFDNAGIRTDKIGKRKLRSFHKGTAKELKSKLREAYDIAMSAGLADMVRQLRIGRNDSCPCGSGAKFKKCCMWKCQ